MIAQIKKDIVPVLRRLGFTGTYPHYRRVAPQQIDLVTFQFYSSGGQFVVEVGKFPPTGYELYGRLIPPESVRMAHLLQHRIRLGKTVEISDPWILFEDRDLPTVTAEVVRLLETEAEEFWRSGIAGG